MKLGINWGKCLLPFSSGLIGKDLEGRGDALIELLSQRLHGGAEETIKATLVRIAGGLCRDSNRGPPRYK
jgi:hypothetical protein